MTQVFANNDQVGDQVGDWAVRSHGGQIPWSATQSHATQSHSALLGPGMTPGKGVRRIRCVGCASETLPRPDDGAPLCQRCCDLLAPAEVSLMASAGWSGLTRTPRWLRRRPVLD